MATAETEVPTDGAILRRLVVPPPEELGVAGAKAFLALGFSPADRQRLLELRQLNQDTDLTESQRKEFDNYLRVGSFLDLLHAHAHAALKFHGAS